MFAKKMIAILILIVVVFVGCGKEMKSEVSWDTSLMEEEEIIHQREISIKKIEEGYYIMAGEFNNIALWEYHSKLMMTDKCTGKTMIINLEEMTWHQEAEYLKEHFFTEEKRIEGIEETANGVLFLVSEERGYLLYHLYNDVMKEVTKIHEINSTPKYKMSDDGSRIAYFCIKDNSINVYNTITKKTNSIPLDIDVNTFLTDMRNNLIFSPKGNFITLILKDKNGIEGFKSYESDNGRLVHDIIYGIYPMWSHHQQMIVFLYRNSSGIIDGKIINDEVIFTSDKIGVYNRVNNTITYLTEVSEPNRIIGQPLWSNADDTLIYKGGIADVNTIYLYNIKNQKVTTLMDRYGNLSNIQLFRGGRSIVYEIQSTNSIIVVEFEGRRTNHFKNVDGFQYRGRNKEKNLLYLLINDKIYYIREGSLYVITCFSSRCIYKNRRRSIERLQYLRDKGAIAAYIQGEDGKKILILPIEN